MYANDRPLLARLLRQSVAIACLCFGLVGLVVPLLPGLPLLLVGALLLRHPTARTEGRAYAGAGLSVLERAKVQLLLVARRITMHAESARLARRARRQRR